jgi:hypothetical protein
MSQYDDRKLCPHCKRKFNSIASERHIPLCAAKQRAKGIRVWWFILEDI